MSARPRLQEEIDIAALLPQTDMDRARILLRALTNMPDSIQVIRLRGDPKSKARPRFGKNGYVYTPSESVAAERATAWQLKQHIREPHRGNVAIACIFFRSTRQRIDADNLLKHVCDAANRIAWLDDSQVTSITGVVEYDPAFPRTVIAIAPHATTMKRGTDDTQPCRICRNPVPLAGRGYKIKYCSAECVTKSITKYPTGPKPCRQCGTMFEGANTRQIMCSAACRVDSLRAVHKARAKPRSTCETCGKVLAHLRGGRCRNCWIASRKQHTIEAMQVMGAPPVPGGLAVIGIEEIPGEPTESGRLFDEAP